MKKILNLVVFLFLCKKFGSHLLSWASYLGNLCRQLCCEELTNRKINCNNCFV